MIQVPLTRVLVSSMPPTSKPVTPIGKTREAAQDQKRDNVGALRVRSQKSYGEIRWNKVISK